MEKLINLLNKLGKKSLVCSLFFFFVFPATTGYRLKGYSVGGGGGKLSGTGYQVEGNVGEPAAQTTGSTYQLNAGLAFVIQADVPTITLTNTGSVLYDKLRYVLNNQKNPTDATFAIAISSDNWVTTNYIKADNTIGPTAVYQTYSAWGSGTGNDVIGLISGTTYKVKARATQGYYSESPFGPEASATTSNPSISFKIDIGGTTDPGTTSPPYSVSIGDLNAGTVTTAANRVWLSLITNANFGGYVYIRGTNDGLKSTAYSYKISSLTTDLSLATEGYGAQQAAVTPTGTLLTVVSPYGSGGNNVGIIASTYNNIFSSNGVSITDGRAAFMIKAKASSTTPASTDYGDTLTIVAASTF